MRIPSTPIVIGCILLWLAACEAPSLDHQAAPPSARAGAAGVQRLKVRVLRVLPHDPNAFTQGLLWHDGALYESTGRYGESSLRRVDPESGRIERMVELPDELFGEGLARVGDELVQLTWHEGVARRYRLADFELLGQWHYAGEGWGLCFDGSRLAMTDGSDRLVFRDPETFEILEARRVAESGRPIDRLNELACAEGWIYANRLGSRTVYRIDPQSGSVTATIDASALSPGGQPHPEAVLNGIAYDPETQRFYLTGKLWANLYEVIFVP